MRAQRADSRQMRFHATTTFSSGCNRLEAVGTQKNSDDRPREQQVLAEAVRARRSAVRPKCYVEGVGGGSDLAIAAMTDAIASSTKSTGANGAGCGSSAKALRKPWLRDGVARCLAASSQSGNLIGTGAH